MTWHMDMDIKSGPPCGIQFRLKLIPCVESNGRTLEKTPGTLHSEIRWNVFSCKIVTPSPIGLLWKRLSM